MYSRIQPAQVTIAQLCEQLGVAVPEGAGSFMLTAVKPLEEAQPEHLSFLDNAAYKAEAAATKAGAVLVREADKALLPSTTVAIVTPQPYVAFAQALAILYPQAPVKPGSAHSAIASNSAQIHPTARLEPGVVIYQNAIVGEGAHIGAHSVIGPGTTIGANTRIGPHCSIFKTYMGDNCLIHPGVQIGQDGFGFALQGTTLHKVPQVGGVVIGNFVEVGANSTIDCGALADTVIDDHVKIDNQVQIGHNVRIGYGTRVVAQTGIAGSSSLGKFNLIGGQSGIAGHLTLADGVALAGRSGLTKSVENKGEVLGGMPAMPIKQWRKLMAALSRLADNPRLLTQKQPETAPQPFPQASAVVVKDIAQKVPQQQKPKAQPQVKPKAEQPKAEASPFASLEDQFRTTVNADNTDVSPF